MSVYGHIIRPQKTLRGMELDMRVSDKLGPELYKEIVESVGHTQKFIVTELPDILIVTQEQFASLNNYTEEMLHTTDRFMITSHNAMEIVIDREYGVVSEIEEAIQEVEGWNEQTKEL